MIKFLVVPRDSDPKLVTHLTWIVGTFSCIKNLLVEIQTACSPPKKLLTRLVEEVMLLSILGKCDWVIFANYVYRHLGPGTIIPRNKHIKGETIITWILEFKRAMMIQNATVANGFGFVTRLNLFEGFNQIKSSL